MALSCCHKACCLCSATSFAALPAHSFKHEPGPERLTFARIISRARSEPNTNQTVGWILFIQTPGSLALLAPYWCIQACLVQVECGQSSCPHASQAPIDKSSQTIGHVHFRPSVYEADTHWTASPICAPQSAHHRPPSQRHLNKQPIRRSKTSPMSRDACD
eukprot:4400464-Amphidinium_carterae.1